MKVGVKFCGNCNPHIDMPGLFTDLASQGKDMTFVCWETADYDVLLVLSGCPTDCTTRPPFSGPIVAATSEAVDRWPAQECELPAIILAALERHAAAR